MRKATILLLTLGAIGATLHGAAAKPWKHEGGKHGWHDEVRYEARGFHAREYKEEFRSGGCKIKRKWDKKGYKEKVKCK